MKQWFKKIMAFVLVGSLLLGSSIIVMAKDVGPSTEDGALSIASDSDSLQVGDTVKVQIIFDTDKSGIGNLGMGLLDIEYDSNVLEFVDVLLEDEYVKKYGETDAGSSGGDGCVCAFVEFVLGKPFDTRGTIATVEFKVIQAAQSTTVYGKHFDMSSEDGNGYHYLYENGHQQELSLTIYDSSTPMPTPDPVPAGTLEFADGTVEGNGDITVPISIKNNDGFAALGLTVTYDATLFDYTGLEVDSSLESDVAVKSIDLISDGEIRAAFVAGKDITSTGNFLNLKLKVKDGVAAGTSSTVGVAVTQAANYDTASLSGTGAGYTVTVKEEGGGGDIDNPEPSGQKLGDVNNDGTIDLVDALYILQNYNNVRELSAAEKTAADVDKDGDVDLVDALNILKYYNGVIIGF